MSVPEVQQITDYTTMVQARVLAQYQQSKRLLGIMEAGTLQADQIEEAIFQVRNGFFLATAVGVQLDTLGKIYRESRNGRTDSDYRDAIRLRAATAISGTPDEIILFLRNFVTGAPSDLQYQPEYPGKYVILTEDPTFGTGVLDSISLAGVKGMMGDPILDGHGDPLRDGHGEIIYSVRG